MLKHSHTKSRRVKIWKGHWIGNKKIIVDLTESKFNKVLETKVSLQMRKESADGGEIWVTQ